MTSLVCRAVLQDASSPSSSSSFARGGLRRAHIALQASVSRPASGGRARSRLLVTASIDDVSRARIKVIGVGGAGGNAVDRYVKDPDLVFCSSSFRTPSESLPPPPPPPSRLLNLTPRLFATLCRMITSGLTGVDYYVFNTDSQVLQKSLAPTRIQIGSKITRGLGAGGNPKGAQGRGREGRGAIAAVAHRGPWSRGCGGNRARASAGAVRRVAWETAALTAHRRALRASN